MCLYYEVDSKRTFINQAARVIHRGIAVSAPAIGNDVTKQRVEVSLLGNCEARNRSFKNNTVRFFLIFESLTQEMKC
jgi:hypothetical protein